MGTAALISLLASLGMGIYNSYQSSQKMDDYKAALQSRMAQNEAKQAQAESPTLSPVGQSYLTAAEQKLKDQTDSLKNISAVSGSGLDVAKAKSVYSSTLGGLVSDLYSKDYALKQSRLNALEGYGNTLYKGYLNSIAQQAGENTKAASQGYAGAVSAATSFLSPDTATTPTTPGFDPNWKPDTELKFKPSGLNK
jgi:Tfp pilus assembly protein PilE